ncbi:MAG: phage major capsid protein [Clostridia bacterium]|nr:phage major capsid protein [Clostridia bacterium]
MITLANAENALKTLYLDVMKEQLNTNINPLLAKIRQSSEDVWGKEVKKVAPFGLNGGVGAGTETGELPISGGNKYAQFTLTLKNLYGTIEISDKAIRASKTNAGAFVNLLNAEMEGLLRASKYNFGRMLYGDGTGVLATVESVNGQEIKLNSVKKVMEGMTIDFLQGMSVISGASPNRIKIVDRAAKTIVCEDYISGVAADNFITVQGSFGNEISGLESIFTAGGYLYGLPKSQYKWLNAYTKDQIGELDDIKLQSVIDILEEEAGSNVDYIVCSSGVKRAYQSYLNTFKKNIDVLNLEGGYKAISYNGIPLLSDKFVEEGTMYLLSSKDFTLYQLCDWSWLEGDDGKIIKQVPNRPLYKATLVKYADLLCDRPYGQAKLTGITEAA